MRLQKNAGATIQDKYTCKSNPHDGMKQSEIVLFILNNLQRDSETCLNVIQSAATTRKTQKQLCLQFQVSSSFDLHMTHRFRDVYPKNGRDHQGLDRFLTFRHPEVPCFYFPQGFMTCAKQAYWVSPVSLGGGVHIWEGCTNGGCFFCLSHWW